MMTRPLSCSRSVRGSFPRVRRGLAASAAVLGVVSAVGPAIAQPAPTSTPTSTPAAAPAPASPAATPDRPKELLPVALEPQVPPEIAGFTVREGYVVTPAVTRFQGMRFLAIGPRGELYVSRPGFRDVLRFTDSDETGFFRTVTTFVRDEPNVHGLCVHDGRLYIATSGDIRVAIDADDDGLAESVASIIPDGVLPRGGVHWWRSLLVTDDAIYTSIGDSGNVTDQSETDRQKIWRFSRDGATRTLFASGIRNTEKLLFRPGTKELWGFDHGSDWFGKEWGDTEGNQPITDLNPPDELNLYVEGAFYGHPFVTGNRLPRPEYLSRTDIHALAGRTTPPAWSMPAHAASNGFTFLQPDLCGPDKSMPADHAGDIFVACRGSWNATQKVGYSVERVLFDAGKPYGMLTIVRTLKPDGTVLARPVDCVQAPDGSVLFSSDAPGRVYRIRHVSPGK